MRKVRLKKIEITNFKKIKHFSADFNGRSAVITGENGVGKTTIIDAVEWLLTDADSQQNSKFNVLMLDRDGNTIEQQSATVTGVFDFDGQVVELSKTFRQKWEKKRGQIVAEFGGHTTDYFFDKESMPKKAFLKELEDLLPHLENIRSCFDIYHFAARLPQEKRRQILIDLSGVDDVSVPAELSEMLAKKSIDSVRKILNAESAKVANTVKDLPKRIDELLLIKPETEGDENALRAQQIELVKRIEKKRVELIELANGVELSTVKARLKDIIDKKNVRQAELDRKLKEQAHLAMRQQKVVDAIHYFKQEIPRLNDQKKALAEEWRKINARLKPADFDTCYACGQYLPQDQIALQTEKFNGQKESEKGQIDTKAQGIIKAINNAQGSCELAQKELEEIDNRWAALMTELEEIRAAMATGEDTQAIEEKIDALSKDIQPEMDKIKATIDEMETEKKRIDDALNNFAMIQTLERQIKERRLQLQIASQQRENIERKLNLLAQYSKARAESIEAKVNHFFKITNWRLFVLQVNGDPRDTCDGTYGGVPWPDLNTGARVNVGLDCALALSDFYKIDMPIFIDNAESVSDWLFDIGADRQIIKIEVKAKQKEIKVEYGN